MTPVSTTSAEASFFFIITQLIGAPKGRVTPRGPVGGVIRREQGTERQK
jgi:hypothetical protein